MNDNFGTTTPQGGQARTGHFGAGQGGSKRRTAVPACEYRKGQMQNGCSKGFGAAGVCPCCPTVGQAGQGQMDGQPYHVGYLFRLCIGADRPGHLKDSLSAAGRGGHKATGNRTTELLFPFDAGESLAQNAGGLPLSGGKHPADRPAETRTCLFS